MGHEECCSTLALYAPTAPFCEQAGKDEPETSHPLLSRRFCWDVTALPAACSSIAPNGSWEHPGGGGCSGIWRSWLLRNIGVQQERQEGPNRQQWRERRTPTPTPVPIISPLIISGLVVGRHTCICYVL